MANFNSWLFRRAKDVTEAAQQQKARLIEEISEAKQKLLESEAALESANSTIDRLDRFEPVIGGDFQCPDCWISDEVRSSLKPIQGEGSIDWFRCETCHSKISNE